MAEIGRCLFGGHFVDGLEYNCLKDKLETSAWNRADGASQNKCSFCTQFRQLTVSFCSLSFSLSLSLSLSVFLIKIPNKGSNSGLCLFRNLCNGDVGVVVGRPKPCRHIFLLLWQKRKNETNVDVRLLWCQADAVTHKIFADEPSLKSLLFPRILGNPRPSDYWWNWHLSACFLHLEFV